jgi:hypothetical protein
MYNDSMRRAVHSLSNHAPKGFYLDIVDETHFLVVRAAEEVFMSLPDVETKAMAVNYMIKVKKALEDCGAIVMLTREGGRDERK